jgi:hypothetical protein
MQIRIWKEAVVACLRFSPNIRPEKLRKTTKEFTIAETPTGFRTRYIRNTSLRRYCYTVIASRGIQPAFHTIETLKNTRRP